MSYFVLMGRRIPKQAITGFRFQKEFEQALSELEGKGNLEDQITTKNN